MNCEEWVKLRLLVRQQAREGVQPRDFVTCSTSAISVASGAMPPVEPSIEEIERDIQRARFEESETERSINQSLKSRAEAAETRKNKGKDAQTAYLAGYKRGYSDMRWAAYRHVGVLFWGVLIAALWLGHWITVAFQ